MPSSSPPTSPTISPPVSQSHLSHLSLTDINQCKPPDPVYGFCPLESHSCINGPTHSAVAVMQQNTSVKQLSQPTARSKEPPAFAKPDYSMQLPRLPTPKVLHYSGLSYRPTVIEPLPTMPIFPQLRACDTARCVEAEQCASWVQADRGSPIECATDLCEDNDEHVVRAACNFTVPELLSMYYACTVY